VINKQNKYIRFCLSLTFLLSILFITDRLIGNFLKHYYFKQTSGLLYRTTFAIDSTTAEMLVFGSSHANHHYVPEIFEEKLKMSFYNIGRDGNYLLYNYAVFKSIINRYSPQIVLFDLNLDELNYNKDNYDRLSALLPYYSNHPEIRNVVNLKSPYEKIKLLSATYSYNSFLLTIISGNIGTNKILKGERKGFIPLVMTLNDSTLTEYKSEKTELDKNKIKFLSEIIDICKLKNIKLFFVISPLYFIVSNDDSTLKLKEIAKNSGIVFLDFTNDSAFSGFPSFFQDSEHLNENGAKVFSAKVAEQISSFVEKGILLSKSDKKCPIHHSN
jgi:hypothetical protein